jgi:hypothetical protein
MSTTTRQCWHLIALPGWISLALLARMNDPDEMAKFARAKGVGMVS